MAFNGRFVLSLIEFAAKRGAQKEELLSIAEETASSLFHENPQIDSIKYNRILERAVETTKDDFLGLHFGESMHLAAAGLIAQITQNCDSVKQAIEYTCEFSLLACSSLPTQLAEEKNFYKLTFTPENVWLSQSPEAVKHTTDGAIVFTLKQYQELTRKPYLPHHIHFAFSKPNDISEYERVLQCPISFGKAETALFFEKEQIEQHILTSDYHLLRILVTHAEEKISRLRQTSSFSEEVKASIAQMIKPQFPNIEQVADHLNLSTRTLQRKLAQEGKTFKEIINSLRKDFALSYLQRQDLSIDDIAFLLNYADSSNFIRSFKRMTGQTPNEFRKRNLS